MLQKHHEEAENTDTVRTRRDYHGPSFQDSTKSRVKRSLSNMGPPFIVHGVIQLRQDASRSQLLWWYGSSSKPPQEWPYLFSSSALWRNLRARKCTTHGHISGFFGNDALPHSFLKSVSVGKYQITDSVGTILERYWFFKYPHNATEIKKISGKITANRPLFIIGGLMVKENPLPCNKSSS